MFGFLKKAVRSVGKAVTTATKATAKGLGSVGAALNKVPIVGKGLGGVFTLTIGAPFGVINGVVSGQRIDKVALNHLKTQIGAIREVAPYVQTVVSFVPGVGQGISGAIGASLALASGQNITSAILSGVKSALPGGPLAKAAFDVGEAAIQGRPLDQVALAAIPLPAEQKKILAAGLATAKALAHGERVDAAFFNNALKLLPADAQKALTVGMALAHGQVIQATKAAGLLPAVTKFDGVPALAIAKGSIRTGVEAAMSTVAAAKSGNPQERKEAQAVVKATIAMAKKGNPTQRRLAQNALRVVSRAVEAQRDPRLPAPAAPAAKSRGPRWQINAQGRIRVLAA
jgi:hypothetical protein